RMSLDPARDALRMRQSTQEEPVPSGVAPYELRVHIDAVDLSAGARTVRWEVCTSTGTSVALGYPVNRVVAEVEPGSVAGVEAADEQAVFRGREPGDAVLTLRYQRRRADGTFADVTNFRSDRAS